MPAVEVQEVGEFVSRVVPLGFFKLDFLQLAVAGSTPCIRVLEKHCLWVILLTVVVLSCGLAAHLSACRSHVYSLVVPPSNMIFSLRVCG